MSRSRSEIWNRHGLKFKNVRWSWSAVNHEENVVSFTVWNDLINPNSKVVEHLIFMHLEDETSLGYRDAAEKITFLEQGYRLLVLFADSTQKGWGTLPERHMKRHNQNLRECDWRYDPDQGAYWCRPKKLA